MKIIELLNVLSSIEKPFDIHVAFGSNLKEYLFVSTINFCNVLQASIINEENLKKQLFIFDVVLESPLPFNRNTDELLSAIKLAEKTKKDDFNIMEVFIHYPQDNIDYSYVLNYYKVESFVARKYDVLLICEDVPTYFSQIMYPPEIIDDD